MDKKNVITVIVTYNRKALLLECLEAVLSQTYSVSKVILIDNASTDGTYEALLDKGYLNNTTIKYIKMNENTGGAGGFYEGIKASLGMKCDWVWIMDDDTIPTDTCLEKLLLADETVKSAKSSEEKREVAFLASAIYGPEGEYMNLPTISSRGSKNGYAYWYQHLKDGMVNISDATFVSILVNKKAIDKCGLPCKDFFIWGDDTEYTTRLTTYFGEAYFVGDSVAIHKRVGAKILSIYLENDSKRIEMFHYFYRNRLINERYYRECKYFRNLIKAFLRMIFSVRNKNKFIRSKVILKGTWEGITQYKKFKKYIDSQIKH